MQHSFPEKYVEQKIADIRREVEHNKRVREAKNANISIQGWVVNKMRDMSVWMMCTGERMHARYHAHPQIRHLHQGSTQAR